jgi:hypothetical protein
MVSTKQDSVDLRPAAVVDFGQLIAPRLTTIGMDLPALTPAR